MALGALGALGALLAAVASTVRLRPLLVILA